MANHDVHFLNSRRGFGWDAQAQITRGAHRAAGFAGHPDHRDLLFASLFNGAQNVLAAAAGLNRHQHISGPRMRRKLASKNVFIPIIVSDGGESR